MGEGKHQNDAAPTTIAASVSEITAWGRFMSALRGARLWKPAPETREWPNFWM